jgi:hypothetical protein
VTHASSQRTSGGQAVTAPSTERPAPSRQERHALRAVLVSALASPPRPEAAWRDVDPTLLFQTSVLHGVAPAVHLALRDEPDLPDDLADALRRVHDDQFFVHIRTLAELRRLGATLETAGVPWAAVKGPVLSETVWPRADMRMYGDLDIVIDRHQLEPALTALAAAGAQLVDRNWSLIRQQMRAELTLTLPYGTHLDLHWHLVNEEHLRRVFRFPVPQMLTRTVENHLADGAVRTLDPVDTCLHLAYHTAHSGGHKLVWFKDIHNALQSEGVDGEELAERAREYGCGLALAVSVRRVQRLFGRIEGLSYRPPRSVWSAAASAANVLRPVPSPPNVRYSGQIVFENTRDSSWASLTSMVRDLSRSRTPRDFTIANPLHDDVDDPVAKAQYLAAVQGDLEP